MPRSGRIRVIPHPKAEPDLDQIVLAVLGRFDEPGRQGGAAVTKLTATERDETEPRPGAQPDERAS